MLIRTHFPSMCLLISALMDRLKMTYWTLNGTHPGNAMAGISGHRNPIKKWAEDGSPYLVYPAIHPLDPSLDHGMASWNIYFSNFSYIGRFGDSIFIESLPSNLQVNSVLNFFGATLADPANTTKALLCGSFGEVSNTETYGDIFDVFTPGRIVESDTIIEVNLATNSVYTASIPILMDDLYFRLTQR